MTGETEREPSGWTPDTLKVLEDEKIAALDRLIKAEIRRLDEAIKAVGQSMEAHNAQARLAQDKFEATVERDSVKQNEFRGSLDDLSQGMATRRETEARFSAQTARIDELAKQIGDLRSRLDVGPVGLSQVQAAQQAAAGRQSGISDFTARLLALAALAATILGLAYTVSHG